MAVSGYEVTPATRDDVPAILDLQEQNLRSNGGALSVRFPREWFEKAISDMPIVVARSDTHVVGYVVSTPLTAQAHNPIIQAMLRAYPGLPALIIMGRSALLKNTAAEDWQLQCLRNCGRDFRAGKALPLSERITPHRETCI